MNDGMDDYGFDWSGFGSGCIHCPVKPGNDINGVSVIGKCSGA
jgi:hypothetical protein